MIEQPYDIYKASGIIIQNRKVLATRSIGKHIFIQPGGKLESGETEQQAVIRELNEEMGIKVSIDELEKIGDYYADAAGQVGKKLKVAAFLVKNFEGIPKPQSEVEEIRAFSSQVPEDVVLASILAHDIIPELKMRNLID
jgi:8-oxo-dGTP diphosphatase